MSTNYQPGRKLLIHAIEDLAKAGHSKTYACIPRSIDPRDGFIDVSYQLLIAAVDRCAHFLDDSVGKAASGHETFAWLAPVSDFRYLLLVLACMKTGHKVFFPSPKNDLVSHLSMLDECQCNVFLTPKASQVRFPVVASIEEKRPMRLIIMPDLEQLFNHSNLCPSYSFKKTFDEARHDNCVVLHTSGSTGVPKVVYIKHGWFTVLDAYRNLESLGVSKMQLTRFEGLRLFIPFPFCHAAAIITSLAVGVYYDMTIIVAPNAPLTAELADLYHVHADVDVSVLPSSVLGDIVANPGLYQNLGKLKYIGYSGSPLASYIGEALQKKSHVIDILGATEASLLPFELTDHDDWPYVHIGPSTGCELRPVSDDQYEMVLVRDRLFDLFQAVFVTFPKIFEWRTRDLYTKHPSKPGLWLYKGRADDIIVFSNGEKLNPISMEQAIESHPEISSVLVVGTGKFQTGLLIEPKDTSLGDRSKLALLERVWPTVCQANSITVAHGRIDKSMIIFTAAGKPFLRAAKGSVQRQRTVALYEDEIDALYEKGLPTLTTLQPDFTSLESIRCSLRDIIADRTGLIISSDDQDFFSTGMDSLQVMNITREINSSLHANLIDPKAIYSHSTIAKLGDHIATQRGICTKQEVALSRQDRMSSIFQRYASGIPVVVQTSLAQPCFNIILTGSTGSLGSYLLHYLLRHPAINKIYCINRSADIIPRQSKVQHERGLSAEFGTKVEFLETSLSQPYLGLNIATYRKLLRDVSHIIHNAWSVDFNQPLESFAPTHIAGVRGLIDFSALSTRSALIYFLSTISSVQNWQPDPQLAKLNIDSSQKVPERIFGDWSVSQNMGYAESKHVSERLLDEAAKLGNERIVICRIGQIAGPVLRQENGMWAQQEWLPSLITSSAFLGKLPTDLGTMDRVDWIPVDLLAQIIVDLSLGSVSDHDGAAGGSARIHHLVNPRATTWNELMPTVLKHLRLRSHPEPVPFSEWVVSLKKSAENGFKHVDRNPAIKLLDFFTLLEKKVGNDRSGVVLDTQNTAQKSAQLRALPKVSCEWMELWMRQWGFQEQQGLGAML